MGDSGTPLKTKIDKEACRRIYSTPGNEPNSEASRKEANIEVTPRVKSKKPILLTGGWLIDPLTNRDGINDILIKGEIISSVGKRIRTDADAQIIECQGYIICPAFCDAHVHLRTPGQQRKENITTGCRAAARGGITTFLSMPNTSPPIDTPKRVASLLKRYADEGSLELRIAGAITRGQNGKEPADWEGMLQAGAIAFTDDGRWVRDDSIMCEALLFSHRRDVLILSHAEDTSLHNRGCINRGKVSRSLKLPGITIESEVKAIDRDIKLAEETGGRLHIQHISTAKGVELVRKAKKKGIKVTCEATPHHLLLTEDAVMESGPQAKMNPPLRTEYDRQALIKGIKDGTIDIIATDHAPHTPSEKRKSLREAPFGVTGLETMFAAVYNELVLSGIIPLPRLIELIAQNPRNLFGLEQISIRRGSRADLVIIDPDRYWTVCADDFKSRGKNNPFIGWTFTGKVLCTIHRGSIVHIDEALVQNSLHPSLIKT
jgi:dihydroorotase